MFGRPIGISDFDDISAKLVGFSENNIKARSFKLLRTTLARQLSDHGHRVVGVTSASPGAGKSFVSSNLAASLSIIADRDVVLVDLDLQRGSVADLYGIESRPGMVEYLLGEVPTLADVARRIGDTSLVVLPTFLRQVNSAELLASGRFGRMIEELKQLPGNVPVICDLPPLFVSDDAMLATQYLDGVILVVEQGVTTKKQVEASLQMLYPTKVYGTVFNRYAGGLADPYGYGGSYGDYYNRRSRDS